MGRGLGILVGPTLEAPEGRGRGGHPPVSLSSPTTTVEKT